jgi:hypothetical protein
MPTRNKRDLFASLKAAPLVLDAGAILDQVSPKLRGAASMMQRPSDVRVLLRTADLQGQEYQFPNHGHPDNEMSNVAFDGANAVMIMPEGENPRRQLFSAHQIVDCLKAEGLTVVTPDFIERHVVNTQALCRKFAAQAYGPAPFDAQTKRFVSCDIPGVSGGMETIDPVVEAGYAIGMRAPTSEEAIMVVYGGPAQNMFIKSGDIAAAAVAAMEGAVPALLRVDQTADEALDGLGELQKAIVLAIDSAAGKPKPIRLESARGIFDLARMNVIHINHTGQVTRQYLNVTFPEP